MKEPVLIHEHVPQFGKAFAMPLLGDLYWIERAVLNCSDMGWATQRSRQFLIFRLKSKFEEKFSLGSHDMKIEAAAKLIFDRHCTFTWRDYMVASDEDLDEEKKWARTRSRQTQERQEDLRSGQDKWGDDPDSFLACLGKME